MKLAQHTAAYFFARGTKFSWGRYQVTARKPCRLHAQDFYEILWIEQGTGLHRVNGQQQPLPPGTLVFIRPTDRHEIRVAPGTDAVTATSILLPCRTIAFLRKRYFGRATTFFWAATDLPFTLQLNAVDTKWLTVCFQTLRRNWYDELAIDLFLLEVLHRYRSSHSRVTAAPAWLQTALATLREPEHLRADVAAFARLAGKCPHHVNRVLRQHYGLTMTEAINQARVEHAAGELITSDKKILEICSDCGFTNASYFYRVFRQHYKTSPDRYRQRQMQSQPR